MRYHQHAHCTTLQASSTSIHSPVNIIRLAVDFHDRQQSAVRIPAHAIGTRTRVARSAAFTYRSEMTTLHVPADVSIRRCEMIAGTRRGQCREITISIPVAFANAFVQITSPALILVVARADTTVGPCVSVPFLLTGTTAGAY